jgi:hypothetical protein
LTARNECRFTRPQQIVIGGKPVDVDAGIAADIAAINARGLSTWVSCQGDDGTAGSPVSRGYIGFTGPPTKQLAPVFVAARAAGLDISEGCIYAAPSDHHDAARELATIADQRAWNAAFRPSVAFCATWARVETAPNK